ncbi:Mur ligase family protein [Maritalea myrionectae]|uniref:Mur ligase family protein n=1 Tax=Maritalea myrionectae TaxID=454601 RepID=UPI000411048E|nr:Mur ligase family protein [Maritalea myrionectae]
MNKALKTLNLAWAERLEPYYYKVIGGIERRKAKKKIEELNPYIVGITGSCGKSTATKILSEMLAKGYAEPVYAGLGNNSKRWVYRSLRKLNRSRQTVEQEISGGEPGYLDYLVADVPLDIAVLTTIGGDHISAFKSEDAILAEKSKLLDALKPEGVACLNIDDPHLARLAADNKRNIGLISYGRAADAAVRAEIVSADWKSRLCFTLYVEGRSYPVKTRFVGTMLLTSILAALAALHAKGLPLEPAIAALADIEPMKNHMSIHKTASGQHLLMDAFKAPYWATKLFAADVSEMKNGKLVVVLGQISDTGNTGSRAYRQIMREIAPHCQMIIGVDGAFRAADKLKGTLGDCEIVASNDIQEIHKLISAQNDALIVVKSGRRSKLWRLYEMTQAPIDCTIMPCQLVTGCSECPSLRPKN